MQQLSIYSYIFAILFSATPPVSPFLRYSRKTGFLHPSNYVSATIVECTSDSTLQTSEQQKQQQQQIVPTCTEVDLLIDLFPNPSSIIRKFHIHGWRWHSLALLRDYSRLEKLAIKLSSSSSSISTIPLHTHHDQITKAIQHVIGFNWVGLYRIEKQVFFPFLRDKLLLKKKQQQRTTLKPSLIQDDTNLLEIQSSRIQDALDIVLKQMEDSRIRIDTISKDLMKIQTLHTDRDLQREALLAIAKSASTLHSTLRSSYELQERIIVPAVAIYVTEKEQNTINFNVLRTLGILDSRRHLVGMREAVWEQAESRMNLTSSDFIDERTLFNEVIPSIPRNLLPRWKRTLYDPQASILDETKQ